MYAYACGSVNVFCGYTLVGLGTLVVALTPLGGIAWVGPHSKALEGTRPLGVNKV